MSPKDKFAILAILVAIMASISLTTYIRTKQIKSITTNKNIQTITTGTTYDKKNNEINIITVSHDGHWFVVLDQWNHSIGGICHHPDCPNVKCNPISQLEREK